MNFYVTSEKLDRLSIIISNIKSFYILDVLLFIESFQLDLTKPSNIYYINQEITSEILSKAKLKKYHGIIYINKSLNSDIIKTLLGKFQYKGDINKVILMDNAIVPNHKDLYDICEEVFFYEPFIKNKIMECKGIYTDEKGNSLLNTNI